MELSGLLLDQSGVVSRRQLIGAGLLPHDVKRLVRRRELASVHTGVYVDHTGPLTWLQRAWAAVLYAEPAALCGESALRAVEGPGRIGRREDLIEIAVDRDRQVKPLSGVHVERRAHLQDRVLWQTGPPRLRYDEAVLDVALRHEGFAAIAVLADAVQGRRTTAARLGTTLDRRLKVPNRRWLRSVLTDIANGTCSVLEHGYLTKVERAHGLPAAARQLRFITSSGAGYRDAEHHGLVVELDGRLFHDSARARDRDLDRDLDAAVTGKQTIRLSWGQVFDRPCATAGRVGSLLQQRGWRGAPRPCGPSCELRRLRSPG